MTAQKRERKKNMIAIGCDHGGVELKDEIVKHLEKKGIECKDVGCYTSESCDYPVYAKKVTDLITSKECKEGILVWPCIKDC